MGDQDEGRQIILDLYAANGIAYCIRCWTNPATCVHEIEPRSQRPNTWMEISNRVPLCNSCHDYCHQKGTGNVADELRERRALYAITFGIELPF